MTLAVVTPSKSLNRYAITELRRFIFEVGRSYATLQSDDENAIKAFVRAALKEVAGLSSRVAPTGSSESQGAIERFHQTLFGQIRVLKIALMARYEIPSVDFHIDHFAYPWLVKHSNWLLNRHLIHDDGKTAVERRWGSPSQLPVCEFGEALLHRVHGRQFVSKGDPPFNLGIWLG